MRLSTPARLVLFLYACLLLFSIQGTPLRASRSHIGEDQEFIRLIVHTAKPYSDLAQGIEDMGGTVTVRYQNVDALAITIPSHRLGRLLASSGVISVEKDMAVPLPTPPGEMAELRTLGLAREKVMSPRTVVSLIGEAPENYRSYLAEISGASGVWDETYLGAGTMVAVIDTGVDATHPCLSGRSAAGPPSTRVIAGPDLSIDRGTEFEGSTASTNNYHGTFAAGMVASDCFMVLDKRVPEDAELAAIFQAHFPPGTVFASGHNLMVPLVGLAPAANIYAVKVFPHTGSGASLSIIESALDHIITLKKLANAGLGGGLDVDIINMSLGGASLSDGLTLEERLVDEATKAGMLVVAAAGNEGPAPVSVSSPGTAYTALTAGAASDPAHTRIFWDLVLGPGQGAALYAGDDFRAADFSARGPLADRRSGPDVVATGVFNISLTSGGGTAWSSGTSFSTPAVAGGAALLTAWAKTNEPEAGPLAIRNAIIEGAVSMGPGWKRRSQGGGYINVANSLDLLKNGRIDNSLRFPASDEPLPNVRFQQGSFTSQVTGLAPARTSDFVFEVTPGTSYVVIDLEEVVIDPDPAPTAIPNSIELYLKGSKRGGTSYILYSANVFGRSRIVIGDGTLDLYGLIFPFTTGRSPLEPGLMKLTIQGDWTNNGNVGTRVTIRRFEGEDPVPTGPRLGQGDIILVPVQVKPGTAALRLELGWEHNWSRFPTNDLDMYLCAPGFLPYFDFHGATINSPESMTVAGPEPGTWYVMVVGFGINTGRDAYYLDVEALGPDGLPPGNPASLDSQTETPGSFHDSEDGHRELVFQGESCF